MTFQFRLSWSKTKTVLNFKGGFLFEKPIAKINKNVYNKDKKSKKKEG